MKLLNTKSGNFISHSLVLDIEGRQPCWYVNLGESNGIKIWVVGCKYDGQSDEYIFELSGVADLSDASSIEHATGKDFAIKLLDTFRQGGSEAIKKWISNSCPI